MSTAYATEKQSDIKISIPKLDLYFGKKQILKSVSMDFQKGAVTSLIGPSGCGKSTLLRSLNRMHDLNPETKIEGDILLDGQSIFYSNLQVTDLRRRVGMVFQRPNPLPRNIYDNIAYGLQLHNYPKNEIPDLVEKSLRDAHIWEEVKDELKKPAVSLSGGQQQRLCIARTIVLKPEVILMDEPCSALDPISTLKIEELILSLKRDYTIIVVTHNMQQAQRISDFVGFMYLGEMVEFDTMETIFHRPNKMLTSNYISGNFG